MSCDFVWYDRSNKDIYRQSREYKQFGIFMLVPVSYLFRYYNQLSKSHAYYELKCRSIFWADGN